MTRGYVFISALDQDYCEKFYERSVYGDSYNHIVYNTTSQYQYIVVGSVFDWQIQAPSAVFESRTSILQPHFGFWNPGSEEGLKARATTRNPFSAANTTPSADAPQPRYGFGDRKVTRASTS
jgi:hypothetical protein